MGTWQDEARERLRSAGYRVGAAGATIVESLAQQPCCRSAQEIHADLGARVGLASVYRVVDALVEQGVVQRVEIGDGIARFEPHRSGEGHHHHLVCNDCGKVEAFNDATLEQAIEAVERGSGYAVAAHDVVLRGACTDCR